MSNNVLEATEQKTVCVFQVSFYDILEPVILMADLEYYYQNLKIKPGSTQGGVLAWTVGKIATLWAPYSGVYHLFGR